MLALHGFDVYGLEISATAVKAAENYAAAEMQNPSAYHFGSRESPSSPDSPGTATFLQGDFFSSKWESKGGVDGTTKFDLAYDYTFLCALHPTQRTQWAASMARILKRDGHGVLICLEFPLYKDPQLPGPPWGLKGVHWDLLALGGDGQVFGVVGEDGKEKCANGAEEGSFRRVLYTKPARSYEVARGTDMLSVYARK
ncbi:uncharacterized protein PFLUO_LOCUS3709 [Penicillium psychrofluorescens]|uniref:uncharacterized protein n=1 Tax=Penicillium psychrofluorescens TaxID=3158075 RepID=UPI003CCDE3A9